MDYNKFGNHQHLHYAYNSDNVPRRIDGQQLSSFSDVASGLLDIPSLQSTHAQQPLESFPSSSASHAQQPYSYHGHTIHVGESSSTSTNTVGRRVTSKRNLPDTSTAYEAEKQNVYYTQASSSVIPLSSDHLHHNMMTGSVRQPCGNNLIPVSQGNRLAVVDDGWQRNVRNRHGDVRDPNMNLAGSVRQPCGNNLIPVNQGNRLAVVDDGWQRNARNQHGDVREPNMNLARPRSHLSHNLSRAPPALDITGIHASYIPYIPDQFQPTGDIHGQDRVQQQIHDFHWGVSVTDLGALGHEMSQPLFQNGSRSGLVMDAGSYGNAVPSRNRNVPLRIFHNSSAHVESRSSIYDQRTVPDRTAWTPMTSSEAGRHFVSESLRNSVPIPNRGPSSTEGIDSRRSYGQRTSHWSTSIAMISSDGRRQRRSESVFRNPRQRPVRGSHNSEMRGWAGSSSRGLYLPPAFGNSRGISEVLLALSHSAFYDHLSSFDEHADMRLDVDNMSYEELLALGERIGNVEAGVSEDMICTCVKEITYSSLGRGQEKEAEKCAICLENYEEKEKIGILQCNHDYHFSCIKDWLQRKTTCPMCKRSVTEK